MHNSMVISPLQGATIATLEQYALGEGDLKREEPERLKTKAGLLIIVLIKYHPKLKLRSSLNAKPHRVMAPVV